MIVGAYSKQGLTVNPKVRSKSKLLDIKGSGVFVSAYITKQGGSNDLSSLDLSIDGKSVYNLTYEAADVIGLDRDNLSGIRLVKVRRVDNLTIQFNEPLHFKKSLKITFNAGRDQNVRQVIAKAVLGKDCSYPS